MALVGALLLVFTILFRPEEFIPQLQVLSLPNLTAAIAVVGIAYELATSPYKVPITPQLPLVVAFFLWATASSVLNLGWRDGVDATWRTLGQAGIFMAIIALATRTYARLRALAVLVVALLSVICAVCIHQSIQPAQCIAVDLTEDTDASNGTPDGRACEAAYLCDTGQYSNTKLDWECEKVGLFGTTTEARRVRWRGTMGDPNELALFVATCIPLLFALASISGKTHVVPVTALLAAGIATIVLSESRGGQVVALTVLGLYFVRRYGFRGLVAGAVFALPILLFGGRQGSEADASAQERTSLLYDGSDLLRSHPFAGVGLGQFQEHMALHLTAHNSYLLAAAELGLLGSFLWALLVYVSIKIPFQVASRPPAQLDGRMVTIATAMVVSYAGMLVGITFLSFCYKQWLFLFFGLSGAMYAAVKQAHPEFEVKITAKEAAYVAATDLAVLVAIFVYSRVKAT